ncbi:MAG: DUF938 domain-containing protein [Pseudomonadota bacterium]
MTRRYSPSAARNVEPILSVLEDALPATGRVLELASGPGQHVAAFAERLPGIEWLPSDRDPDALASIEVWRQEAPAGNVAAPLTIDLLRPEWPAEVDAAVDGAVAINVCHISPWAASVGLLTGAAAVLVPGGALFIYGPFMRDGGHTADSNAAFDASLRGQNPAWGVRAVEDLNASAAAVGLGPAKWHDMPSNNAVLEFRRR